jgi:cyclopropane-fatty-acyl-phospholipid synthase
MGQANAYSATPGAATGGRKDHPRSSAEKKAERAVARVHGLLRAHGDVDLPLRLWNGRRLGPADPDFLISLEHPGSLRAMLWPPSDVAAGEAYLNGAIDIEGDIVGAIAAGARLGALTDAPSWRRASLLRAILAMPKPPARFRSASGRAHLRGRMHTRERDRQAIAFHYDLPVDFYSTFLDSELVYSCAYFDEPMGDLDLAQRRKVDLVCRKLRLRPGQRLLDVGCGFGPLLRHAARHYGVTGVGVTLSRTQADTARELIAAAGLSDRIEVRLMDYRDVDERFDAVASIGMIEHVGPEQLDTWFATVRGVLRPGGLMLCHAIVLGDAEHLRVGDEATFVTSYVFPDGGLVPAWRAVRHLQQGGFRLLDVEQLRPHYAWTLRKWMERLETGRGRAVAAADERAFRTWRTYMAGSAYSFETDSLEVVQMLGRAPGPDGPELPVGRGWMAPQISSPA